MYETTCILHIRVQYWDLRSFLLNLLLLSLNCLFPFEEEVNEERETCLDSRINVWIAESIEQKLKLVRRIFLFLVYK